MKNRVPAYLADPKRPPPAPQPAVQAVSDWAKQQIPDRIRQVEKLVHAHPELAIGAAFCLGGFLGWVIKRK